VFVPLARGERLLESGRVVWEQEATVAVMDGIRTIDRAGDLLVCTVGSGEYSFAGKLPEWRP
jgi:hypothetical protein